LVADEKRPLDDGGGRPGIAQRQRDRLAGKVMDRFVEMAAEGVIPTPAI
jgi:hypothetical protein